MCLWRGKASLKLLVLHWLLLITMRQEKGFTCSIEVLVALVQLTGPVEHSTSVASGSPLISPFPLPPSFMLLQSMPASFPSDFLAVTEGAEEEEKPCSTKSLQATC